MSSLTSLVPVRATELKIGKPAPWPIYNEAGELLLARGTLVDTQAQLDGLVANGLYRNPNWVAEPDTESVPKPTAHDELRKRAALERKPLKPPASVRGTESVITLDEVRWKIGDTLWLQFKEDASLRYAVNLIGSIANKSLLVTAPMKDGKLIFIRDGQPLVVRALSGKRAYAFGVQLLKSQQAPAPYLHLSWPWEVRSTVIRQDSRVPVSVEGYLVLGATEPTPASVLDLSMGGASLIAASFANRPRVAKGCSGSLRMVVTVADQQLKLELPVVLRTEDPTSDPMYAKYGVEFAGMPARDKLVLSAFIFQSASEQE